MGITVYTLLFILEEITHGLSNHQGQHHHQLDGQNPRKQLSRLLGLAFRCSHSVELLLGDAFGLLHINAVQLDSPKEPLWQLILPLPLQSTAANTSALRAGRTRRGRGGSAREGKPCLNEDSHVHHDALCCTSHQADNAAGCSIGTDVDVNFEVVWSPVVNLLQQEGILKAEGGRWEL